MHGDVILTGREGEAGAEGERLGGRIDAVRERAEKVGKALEGVRV